jgi:hypothetical protein
MSNSFGDFLGYAQPVKTESQRPPGFESMEEVPGMRGVYKENGFTKRGSLSVQIIVSVAHVNEHYGFNIKKEGEDSASLIVVNVKDGGKRDKIFEHTSVHMDDFNISAESKKLRPFVEWVRKFNPNLVDYAAEPAKVLSCTTEPEKKFTPLK